jgi:hypothetical protein
MQKTYLFNLQIGMPQANALNFIGYTDTVLFLTISKPDIYHHRSLGKLATFFGPCDQKLPIVGKSTVSVNPTEFRCICKRH